MHLETLKDAVENADTHSLWRYKISYSGGRQDRAKPVVMETKGKQSPANFFNQALSESVSSLGEALNYSVECVPGDGQCMFQSTTSKASLRIKSTNIPIAQNSISDLKDLQNTKYYCVKFKIKSGFIHAFKWIGATWSTKNTSYASMFINEGSLKQLEEDHSFRVTKNFDVIVMDNIEYIINFNPYSQIFDYKENLLEVADSAYTELIDLGVLTSSEKIKKYVGNNSMRLKRLSEVVAKGFYAQEKFMKNLKANNKELKFNFKFVGDKIEPEENKISELLTALGDRRLTSMNSGLMYDANSTQQV
ncbi:DUF4868 domain-containing protein [Maridesulfovibrio salexigens]|uniref:DUF4868 domain-containing protein n=1 Tax=Maridesulfovibrio salexigens (strain ATCC 14822 / DSM 2638 / NCIMB 8403 / VKM B-1763) TaxID=526222 RepID=C6BRN2_MARSD|nr:DUF4868 domain-containing protein [Maridesulfovibrio salexigens]ACS79472.1 hypothetical protein Desal_1410 [Maridesulfovibrio salexigens DSM 2638]